MIIQIIESTIPASKNGMGIIKGPTPNNKLTEVKSAEYLGCILNKEILY